MDDVEALWIEEAIHRANNFAQLAVLRDDLQRRGVYKSENLPADELLVGLGETYRALNQIQADSQCDFCRTLLTNVVSGLITLFGMAPCEVRLRLDLDEFYLECDRRRALVLLASELTVNAIKHGFNLRERGTLCVSLKKRVLINLVVAELVVADDGVGVAPNCREGLGTGIINGLCLALDGQIKRTAIVTGGLHISIFFPLLPAEYAGRSGR